MGRFSYGPLQGGLEDRHGRLQFSPEDPDGVEPCLRDAFADDPCDGGAVAGFVTIVVGGEHLAGFVEIEGDASGNALHVGVPGVHAAVDDDDVHGCYTRYLSSSSPSRQVGSRAPYPRLPEGRNSWPVDPCLRGMTAMSLPLRNGFCLRRNDQSDAGERDDEKPDGSPS